MQTSESTKPKPLVWIGSSRKDLRSFPEEVRDLLGYALYVAQLGGKHPDAKPLKGFGGAGVLEIVDDHQGGTYRAVYTVTLREVVYVLHAFQKKSTAGVATRKEDVDLIKRRLRQAQELYDQEYGK
jgi:phage-related protein